MRTLVKEHLLHVRHSCYGQSTGIGQLGQVLEVERGHGGWQFKGLYRGCLGKVYARQLRTARQHLFQSRAVRGDDACYLGVACVYASEETLVAHVELRDCSAFLGWRIVRSAKYEFLQHRAVRDVPTLGFRGAAADVEACKACRTEHIEHRSCACGGHAALQRVAFSCFQIAAVHTSVRTVHAQAEETVLRCRYLDADVRTHGSHLERIGVQLAHLIVAVTVGKAFLKRHGQVLIPQSVYGIVVVCTCLGVLDVLALSVKRAGYLRPLRYAVGDPEFLATVCGENLDAVRLRAAHVVGDVVQRDGGLALIFKPELVGCVALLEHHGVPPLVVMLGVGHAVQVPRYGDAAVVVGKPAAISIIPVVEVGACQSVGVEVERNHHVLRPLVNGKHIVRTNYVAPGGAHVGILIEFLAELLQSVLLGSCHALAVQGDVSICLGAVLRALLRPQQPFI